MNKKVFIRSDASKIIGLGHITRCIALSQMIDDILKITFICRGNNSHVKQLILYYGYSYIAIPDDQSYYEEANNLGKYLDKNSILILDGYNFNSEYQKKAKEYCYNLICIDDIHDYHFFADIVINYSFTAQEDEYSCEPYTKLCLGSRYSLLRKPFLQNRHLKKDINKPLKNIMVAMGGSDITNQSLKILKVLLKTRLNFEVNIVTSSLNPNIFTLENWIQRKKKSKLRLHLLKNLNAEAMCYQFIRNDLLFTTGSVTAIEACSIGIPMIVGIIANNQKDTVHAFEEFGVAYNINNYNDISVENLKSFFLRIINNNSKLNELIIQQKKLIDRKVKERLRQLLFNLYEGKSLKNDIKQKQQNISCSCSS